MTKYKWLKIINLCLILLNVIYLVYFAIKLVLTINNIGVFGIAFFVISLITVLLDITITIIDIIISKNF